MIIFQLITSGVLNQGDIDIMIPFVICIINLVFIANGILLCISTVKYQKRLTPNFLKSFF